MKISIIGAGSLAFSRNLIVDILLFTDLKEKNLKLSLMDIDSKRLEVVSCFANELCKEKNIHCEIERTTQLDKTLDEANYVITIFQTGGLEARKLDIEVPKKYGVPQSIGDTLGPGGVFKAIRTVPVLLEICSKMEKLCPDALLLNYTNPMAINTWAINEVSKIKNIGLCHGIEHSKKHLSKYTGKPLRELSFSGGGINHMFWFLKFEWKGKDAYPILMEKIKIPSIYQQDPIRFEILKYTGYFCTESCYHIAEYLPYFKNLFSEDYEVKLCKEGEENTMSNWGGRVKIIRKGETGEKIEQFIPIGWDVKRIEMLQKYQKLEIKEEFKQSVEYAPKIINAMENGKEIEINGNVMNKNRKIENLPENCCVEVPCKVDKTGIKPYKVGKLPEICAWLNCSNIAVQELAVKGILQKDRRYILQSIIVDPLTSSILPLSKIKEMVEEMFKIYKDRFPQYYGDW